MNFVSGKIAKDTKFLIIGLGLIGGSYAQGLTNAGFYVGAITRSEKSIEYGLKNKIIKEGTTKVSEEFVKKYDIIIFSLYPDKFVEWIKQYQSYIKDGALITDVTGIKSSIVYEIQSALKSSVEFVPAHPMAGREVCGVENSSADILKGSNYIVTPTSENTQEAIEKVKEIGRILGFRKISILSPQKHDEMIGFLSQLTHCIAVSLMVCKESSHLVDYAGDSFRDLTRIARINDEMWSELFIKNKNELLSQMDLFLEEFKKLRNALAQEDRKTMRDMMVLSTKRRAYFDKEENLKETGEKK